MRDFAIWQHGVGRLLYVFAASAVLAAPAPADGPRTIVGIEMRGPVVLLTTAEPGKLDLRSYALTDPSRLVFDISNARLGPAVPASQPVEAARLERLRVACHEGDPSLVRLVLDASAGAGLPSWSVESGASPGETRIVLEAAQPAPIGAPSVERRKGRWVVRVPGAAAATRHLQTIDAPPRVCADLDNAVLGESVCPTCAGGPVCAVRGSSRASEGAPGVRLVIDLAEAQTCAEEVDGADLLLCLGEPSPAGTRQSGKGRLSGKLIVVDPGHGGHDTGALSGNPSSPAPEKDIVLDIGLRLAHLLGVEGATVRMTRDDDTFVELHARSDLANRLHADAFVSIHCNSSPSHNIGEGTGVYYDHENGLPLAEAVRATLKAALDTQDRGIRNANFSVIRGARCPGILVETAFINNDRDRELLTDPAFREKVARAILEGVVRFFSASPNAGTPGE